MTKDERYMRRCIQLAKNGQLNAPPNPMVGAVIVVDNRIIGEGYHIRCGEGHAEVNAFASIKSEDEPLLSEATIYVSLEPCSHYGKTPPCADLIIRKGVKRVVVGCIDPFAEVQGQGIQKLKNAGIEVIVGVCKEECEELNKFFFTFHRQKRPFITLKWAESKDGFIAKIDSKGVPQSTLISTEQTRMHCHKLRSEHQAILVGRATLETDNPSLTTRYWEERNPIRIVLTHGTPDKRLNIFNNETTTLVMTGMIADVMRELHTKGIQSLLVEGGREVLQQFIDHQIWDEAYIEKGDIFIRNGIKAPTIPNQPNIHLSTFYFFDRRIVKIRHFLQDDLHEKAQENQPLLDV